MGKAEKEQLNRALIAHLNSIHETLQMLDQTPPSMEKVAWAQVIQLGDQVSKQATIAGMLWNGESPDAKQVEETMNSFFNVLQGFLLLSHGSNVGAGPTLSSSIHESVKHVVDSSFRLMKEHVSLYGSHNKEKKLSMPQFVGAVWEACSALKKVPATNVIAIGRAMTQVAVSVKDVVREMNELKPASSDLGNGTSDDTPSKAESKPEDEDLSDDDLGSDLSPEEMKVAQFAQGVVSRTLVVIKELIRTITGMLKLETPDDNGKFVDSLEKLLKICQGVGAEIDEIGACLYPPQEIDAIKLALEKISSSINGMQQEVDSFQTSAEPFVEACGGLRTVLKQMESEIDCFSTTELTNKMQNVAVMD
ncbi:Sec-independent periplasmic protein translocase [Hibiscus syriacus]|uniref:Sec-independent periplasmic protein translocase n=1 Tax=Hibiscus syriacus TaxID=106335 RepID=A0A6A3B925_HIBSY|nr:uncharacterized protein LOC120219371 [Hibiscus syriacus]KAE8713540.1 Sec-independent periplasmic protein translocase [Hibiscus syriacus]